jgi:hypothetical protein
MRRAPGLLALGLVLAGGCASDPNRGYVFGSTYAGDVKTVAVPIFENATFTPGLEQALTESIVREIQSSTPWRIAGREGADTVLLGVITQADLETLTRTPGIGLAQEQIYQVRVDFTWRDNRTGEVRVARERFSAATTFVPARGVERTSGERIEIGQREALEEMARAIVDELRSEF